MSVESSLRQTSDTLLVGLDELAELEDEKRRLRPGDPRLVEIAARVEEVAEQVLGASVHQRELTEEAQELARDDVARAPQRSIEESSRAIADILAEWRSVERRLAAVPPGSDERRALDERAASLREEYGRAVAMRADDGDGRAPA
jgi:hypothetical protein